jgi:hypothetical protein
VEAEQLFGFRYKRNSFFELVSFFIIGSAFILFSCSVPSTRLIVHESLRFAIVCGMIWKEHSDVQNVTQYPLNYFVSGKQ